MELTIDFPKNLQVDAHLGNFTVHTDQPLSAGGDGSAPTPFALFLSSIGTCAGIYILGFCRQRNLPTENVRIVQRMETDPKTGLIGNIELEIQIPPDFPEKYRDSLVRSANLCAVKKHLENPPKFNAHTTEN
ncbi:MAG: OsmC family protein [Candidatus Neomarinimicrobiota bacterium]